MSRRIVIDVKPDGDIDCQSPFDVQTTVYLLAKLQRAYEQQPIAPGGDIVLATRMPPAPPNPG